MELADLQNKNVCHPMSAMILLYHFYARIIVALHQGKNVQEENLVGMECRYVKIINVENHAEDRLVNQFVILMNTYAQLENVFHPFYFVHHNLFVQSTKLNALIISALTQSKIV